ncbi:MAG: hypothetical protein OEV44_01265 [Spirochaetota bacterium]|nr:hypothetical protein [Spirochaetota bacterium]
MSSIKSGLSILWQLIIAGIILTSFVISLFTYYLISNEQKLVMEQAKLRAITVTSFVSLMLNQASRVEETLVDDATLKNLNITLQLRFLNKDVLQNVIELAQFHHDIKLVKIIDHNFNIIASYPYGLTGKAEESDFLKQSLAGQQLPRTKFIEIKGSKLIEITVPLVVYGSIAGTMYMGFSTEHLNEKIKLIIQNAVLLAIIFIIGQSIVISIFARIYTKPILELASLAKRISKGDRVKIPVTKKDEIGYLQLSFRDAIDRQNKAIDTLNRTNIAYSHFIPKEFLQFLNRDSIIDVRLGDQIIKEMTILFSDIRSFTTLSESMTPVENFNFLNDFLKRMGPIIRNFEGFIDKYIGDAIMALFPNRVEDAIKAAIHMIIILNQYNKEREKVSRIPIRIGIGIHTGTLMLGTIGESERMETTVIADAVNLSSRIEGLTKKYGIAIAVSKDVLEKVTNSQEFHTRYIDKVLVKGKEKSVDIYEVYDGSPDELLRVKEVSKPFYEKGINYYYNRQFLEAKSQFEKALNVFPEDKVTKIYYDRVNHYLVHPPDINWTGVETMDSK